MKLNKDYGMFEEAHCFPCGQGQDTGEKHRKSGQQITRDGDVSPSGGIRPDGYIPELSIDSVFLNCKLV